MYEFRWKDYNRQKCSKHGVSPDEAEFVVNHPDRGFPRKIGDRKLLAMGQTEFGRYLEVIYLVDSDGTIFVIHCRPLTEPEKRALRRRRR